MTHVTRFAALAILAALVLCVPVQAQTPEIDALRARAEAQYDLGSRYATGCGVSQDDDESPDRMRLGVYEVSAKIGEGGMTERRRFAWPVRSHRSHRLGRHGRGVSHLTGGQGVACRREAH